MFFISQIRNQIPAAGGRGIHHSYVDNPLDSTTQNIHENHQEDAKDIIHLPRTVYMPLDAGVFNPQNISGAEGLWLSLNCCS